MKVEERKEAAGTKGASYENSQATQESDSDDGPPIVSERAPKL